MPEGIQSARCRVTLTVELNVSSVWGYDCSIKQVHEQAASEAIGMIRNATGSPQGAEKLARAIKVIGEPEVTAVIVVGK